MDATEQPTCRIVRPNHGFAGKQGLNYMEGISAESVGSKAICMHVLTMPPGARAKAHLHENHETAIYMLAGEADTWYGDRLQHHVVLKAGELMHIPAGVPHLPANRGSVPATAIIARTDPNEQESVVLLPELEALVPA